MIEARTDQAQRPETFVARVRQFLNPDAVEAERSFLSAVGSLIKRIQEGELSLPYQISPESEWSKTGKPGFHGGFPRAYGRSGTSGTEGPVVIKAVSLQKKTIEKLRKQNKSIPSFEIVEQSSFTEVRITKYSENKNVSSWKKTVRLNTDPSGTIRIGKIEEICSSTKFEGPLKLKITGSWRIALLNEMAKNLQRALVDPAIPNSHV